MSKLFETTRIKSLTMPNRFVRSATTDAEANPDGSVTPLIVDDMVKLARGGVGLIVTAAAFIGKEGQLIPRQLGVDSDDLLPGLSEMTRAVHMADGKIVMQVCGGGGVQSGFFGFPAMGPSVMQGEKGPLNREMTVEDIRGTVDAFGRAAERAKKAGFDGVQFEASQGYLLSEFLSPYFNKRSDAYGGSIGNRSRIVLEAINSVREAVGNQYPVMIKMNSEDLLPGGLSVGDMLTASAMFEDAGIDAIELCGGTTWALRVLGKPEAFWARTTGPEAYWREATTRLKKTVHVPVMLGGGVRSYEVADRMIEEGVADYITMSRPFIREPDLINRWRSGDTRKATCVSDNACFGPERMPEILAGKGLRCVHVEE
jgi:2,4-dienoyl-CoA reductase-like NADH-dependent reductase (Old Yellow Enzyme family)